MKIRVFEAFAGYGSQSIALRLLTEAFPGFQFQTVGISEIDKYAIKAYKTLHGDTIPNHGDITKIDWTQTADFDLLTYSFPCQDISSAGKQRGFSKGSGTRSSCLWACADAIEVKRPQFLLMENVKALTQNKFADDFTKWREWLIARGYTNYYAILNSKDYGVPQNRERVFMVSFRGEHERYFFPAPFELTRPLKLDTANVHKTIDTIIQRGFFRKGHNIQGGGYAAKSNGWCAKHEAKSTRTRFKRLMDKLFKDD